MSGGEITELTCPAKQALLGATHHGERDEKSTTSCKPCSRHRHTEARRRCLCTRREPPPGDRTTASPAWSFRKLRRPSAVRTVQDVAHRTRSTRHECTDRAPR